MCELGEFAVNAGHALDLAFGRETLIEAFRPEVPHVLLPRCESLLPAVHASLGGLGIGAGEIGAHADHRLDGDRLGHHVAIVAPCITPDPLGRFEEISHDTVVALLLPVRVTGLPDLLPVTAHPTM